MTNQPDTNQCSVEATGGYDTDPDTNALYQEGIQYIATLQKHADLEKQKAKALEALSKSPEVRNALMALSPPKDGEEAVRMETVLAFHLEVSSSNYMPAKKMQKTAVTKNSSRDQKRKARKSIAISVFQDTAIFRHCQRRFPSIVLPGLLSKPPFLVGLIGAEILDSGGPITMSTLYSRLSIIEEKVVSGCDDCRKPGELGRSWIPHNRHPILMDCEKSWQLHFETVLMKAGYLDDLAGISFPGKHRNNEEESFPRGTSNGSTYSIDSEDDMSFGGFVEWSRNCFSPQFLAYFYNDVLPTMYFMQYPGVSSQVRHIRCESPAASHSNPVYFQLGVQPNACLIQASESSKFGDCLLKICNFVEEQRFDHVFGRISLMFGQETAREFTPPRKAYDLLFAMVGENSFKYHSDSREMLFDESIPGWEEIHLRVVTMFFQNTEDQVIKMRLKRKQNSGISEEKQIPLGPSGMHEQGYGNQANLLHSATMSSKPKHFRRMVWTARATLPLQVSGLKRLRRMQEKRLTVYSGLQEYAVNGYGLFFPTKQSYSGMPGHRKPPAQSWKSPNALSSKCHALHPNSDTEEDNNGQWGGPSDQSEDGFIEEEFSFRSPIKECIYFGRRVGDFEYYPTRTASVLVGERQSVTDILASLEGQEQLCSYQIRLLVEDDDRCTPFGPCPINLEAPQSANVAPIGMMLPWVATRKYYGVPTSRENSAPWNTPSHRVSSLYLFKRYKTPLESSGSPHSAASEAHSILNTDRQERKGFYVYFSGGNGYDCGSVPPDAQRELLLVDDQPGVGLFSPTGMTLKDNPRNMSLFEASTKSRVVTVFIAGQNLPRNLRHDKKDNLMCLHAGQYLLHPMEVCTPQSAQFIQRSIEACKQVNLPMLDPVETQHLGFLTRVHFRCWVSPIDVPVFSETDKWKTLTLPLISKERFAYPVPRGSKGSDLVLQSNITVPTSKELIETYLMSRGVIEDRSCAPDRVLVDTLKKRKLLSPLKVVDTLRRLMLAYSMRVLKLNVDDDDRIACLADIPKSGEVKARRYEDLFGDGGIRYCAALGENAQVHPYPCPLPAGDAKMVYLQEANIGGNSSYQTARQARGGLEFLRTSEEEAAKLLLQSFVSETTGNPNANQMWADAYISVQGSHPQLPDTVEKCRHYLSFIRSAIGQGKGTFGQFQQGHYKLHSKLQSFDSYSNILMKFASNAHLFIKEVVRVSDDYHRQGKDPSSLREVLLRHFQSWLLSITNTSCWDPFHLNKIFAAMEELIADKPFGDVGCIPLGFGSRNGMRLIDWSQFQQEPVGAGGNNISIEECTEIILQHLVAALEEDGDDWFGFLYKDSNTGLLHQRINGRELNSNDIDHFLCKIFLYFENEPHGSRAQTKSPRPQTGHCFPMKSFMSQSLELLAREALRNFKLEHRHQGFNFFPYSEERAEQASLSAAMLRGWSFEGGRRGGGIVYVNPRAVEGKVPPVRHEYKRRTYACWKAWRQGSATAYGKLKVLENGYGFTREQTTDYAQLPTLPSCTTKDLPMVAAARLCEASMRDDGLSLCDTFTLHSQVEGNCSSVTTFDYHIDKPTPGGGPVLFFPIEGECYFLLSSSADHLERLDDSRVEFSHWKSSLSSTEKVRVDSFLDGFHKYAIGLKQPYMNVYKSHPGTAILFRSSEVAHGVVVPAQEEGKTRKVLLFHPLLVS